MDEEGSVLATQGDRTVAGFDATFKRLQRLFDLRAKARSGDAAAEIDVALLEGDLELIAFDEVQKRLEGKKLSDAQNGLFKDVELSSMMAEVDKAPDEAAGKAVAKKLADAYAAGRLPATKERKQRFFFILLQYADSEQDADLAQKALDAVKPMLKEEMGDDPRLAAWIQKRQDAIEELRAKKEGGCGGDEGMEEGCGEGGK